MKTKVSLQKLFYFLCSLDSKSPLSPRHEKNIKFHIFVAWLRSCEIEVRMSLLCSFKECYFGGCSKDMNRGSRSYRSRERACQQLSTDCKRYTQICHVRRVKSNSHSHSTNFVCVRCWVSKYRCTCLILALFISVLHQKLFSCKKRTRNTFHWYKLFFCVPLMNKCQFLKHPRKSKNRPKTLTRFSREISVELRTKVALYELQM